MLKHNRKTSIAKMIKNSFFIMVIIPFLTVLIAAITLGNKHLRILDNLYEIKTNGAHFIKNPILIIQRITENEVNEILQYAETDVDKLTDIPYLNKLSNNLLNQYAYIVVKKENEYIYVGEYNKWTEVKPILNNCGFGNNRLESFVFIETEPLLLRQLDFKTSNGLDAQLFIIIDTTVVYVQFTQFLKELLIVVIICLVVIAISMSISITRSITAPLKDIQSASDNITTGNLDLVLHPSKFREMADLGNSFEEMRLRLQEMANKQVLYDKESKELISNISHDLKTPITAIKGYIEGLLDGVADTPEKREKYIRTIYSKATAMDSLIDELFLYSQIDTKKIPYSFTKLNLKNYFLDCVEEISLDLEKNNITFNFFNYCDNNVCLIADPEQLKRVISNIISNSVKYMKFDSPKKVINLKIVDKNDLIKVSIEDNGRGIADAELLKIFERFYRTEISRNSLTGGGGLGLAICKRIVEEHGGRIWANSKEGEGTEILFTLKKYKGEDNIEESINS